MLNQLMLQGRKIVDGQVEGPALVTQEPLSFMGSINPKTGVVIERGHELEGQCLQGKILVFPCSKGSTGGSYMLYDVVKNGVGPLGIVNIDAESVVVIGAIVADLPMIDQIDIRQIQTGDYLVLNASEGRVEVRKSASTTS
jgi:predicted aconitase with swiveling domain